MKIEIQCHYAGQAITSKVGSFVPSGGLSVVLFVGVLPRLLPVFACFCFGLRRLGSVCTRSDNALGPSLSASSLLPSNDANLHPSQAS